MSGVTRRLLGLCLPPLLAWGLDVTLTLVGQSADYWAGNYAAVNEASPTFNQLLQIHPMAFVLGDLVWAAVFVGIILLLPDTLALIISIAVTFGHTIGAATWMLWRFEYRYQASLALLLGSSVVLGLGVRYGWRAAPAEEYNLRGWSWRWRWIVSACLFAVGVYLYLWPRST